MKKYLTIFGAIALFGLTACQQENIPENLSSDNTSSFTFKSVKPALDEETPTKTEWTGETIQWSAGDQIRMAYTVDGKWQGASDDKPIPKLYASNYLEAASDVAEFTVNSNFTSTATGTHIFYGLYPASLSESDFSGAPKAAITIPIEQTPAANSFDGAADVMIGMSEELSTKPASGETVLMNWTRLVAHADLTIKNLTINDGETIESITLKAQEGADLVGMHNLNLVTGEFSNAQGATNEIVIKAANLTYSDKTIKVWASMLPATLTELTVTVETDKAYYVRSFTGISREFKKNMRNTMNIGMTSAVRTSKAANLEDYTESFNNTLGDFTIEKQTLPSDLTYVWTADSRGYAKASAYKSGPYSAVSYLVSPELTIGSDKSKLTFDHAANYLNGASFDNNFSVVVFDGEVEEVLTLDVKPNGSSWTFVTSTVSLSKYNGKSIKIGFKYTSTDQLAGTWEVKNFKVTDIVAAAAPEEFTITVNNAENGTVTTTPESATEGTVVTITVAPDSGYELDELSVMDASNNPVTVSDYQFTMPASNVTIYATFKEIDPSTIEEGATWTYTFDKSQFSATNKTVTLNDQSWTMSGTGGEYFGYDATKGQQFGSGSKPYSAITLTSNFGNKYGIESVAINTSGSSGIDATVSVSVNGVSYKYSGSEEATLTALATTYTFNSPSGLNAGDIVISFANASSKAIYVKAITVNPEGTIVDPVKLVMSNITCTNSGQNENSLTFTWNAVENAEGYQVSVDDGASYGETQTETTYTWTELTAGNTYTIKVKAIGDGTNYLDSDPKSCSGATMSVQSGDDVYSLYNGELTDGDYIIVYGNNAMKNTISSSRLTYSTVTITDDAITGPGSELVWHIENSGEYWTIYNAAVGKYAASTGAKNQAQLLDAGTDDMALWTASVDEGGFEFVNKANKAKSVNANLRNNGTFGFACYSASTGGALRLYKKN